MQGEIRIYKFQLGGPDQLRVRHRHSIELALEIAVPKIKETFQLRKAGVQIIILPDITLEQAGMIWQAV
jgi:hypothetical protein